VNFFIIAHVIELHERGIFQPTVLQKAYELGDMKCFKPSENNLAVRNLF